VWFSNDCFKLTYVVDQHVVEKNFDHVVSSRAILSTLTGLASSLAWFSSPSSDCLCIFGLCSAMCIDIFLLHFSFTFTWWDWPSTWLTNHRPSVLWHCWLGHVTRKTVSEMTYSVSSWTLNSTVPVPIDAGRVVCCSITVIDFPACIIGDHQELTAENLASFRYFLPH